MPVVDAIRPSLGKDLEGRGYHLESLWKTTYMSRLYRGTCRRTGTVVALKVLRQGGATGESQEQRQEAKARFHREVALLKRAQGLQNVVQLLEVGDLGGLPFHICRWASGCAAESLLQRPEQRTRSSQVSYVLGLVDVLLHLHEIGIVHRDVAPDHVFWTDPGATTLIDFGMAASMAEISQDKVRRYVRHDLFTTGLLLFEMLEGRRRFDYGKPQLEDQAVVAVAEVRSGGVDPDLGVMLTRALRAKEPVAERVDGPRPYASMKELQRDLASWLTFRRSV